MPGAASIKSSTRKCEARQEKAFQAIHDRLRQNAEQKIVDALLPMLQRRERRSRSSALLPRASKAHMSAAVVRLVCGVDEAGRGPLAGPVYAACVILDPRRPIRGLADSKVLTPERREVLALRIRERAIAFAVASASVEEIDAINILQASLLAMRRAVQRP